MTHPKAGSALNALIAKVEAGEISAEEAAKEAPIHRGDSVGVAIHLSGNVDGLVRFLEANGAANISAFEDYIEAYVPVLILAATSEQPGVIRLRPIQPPEENQSGSGIPGNGPAVHNSTAWNQAGYTGQGIKVGVIDGGFGGLDDLMGTEVPATVQARCYKGLREHSQDLGDCGTGTSNTHGTVVAESVVDIAPDVSLYIANPKSPGDLSHTVDWMISEGVSVINHSRTWLFDGPGDGTSLSSVSSLNTVNRAVAAGIVWVNAAGNSAQRTWFRRGPFSYSTISVNGEDVRVLNFEGSNFKNQFQHSGSLQLRWDDTWGGATRDLDLYLVTPGSDTEVEYASIDLQNGGDGHNPYERVVAYGTYDIVIAHFSGSEPGWIQLLAWRGRGLTFNTPGTGSITNPAESANPGMLTVGAAHWNNVNSIEAYSSRGPTPDGGVKPDVVAADCGQTAADSGSFCGTSQASPHVAGMAALVRQRFPEYPPAQVASYLKENGEQRLNSPDPNNTWGHGFVVLSPPAPQSIGSPSIQSITPDVNSLTVSWTAPTADGGSAITAYDLRHIRSDATSRNDAGWAVVQDVWVSGYGALSYELTGLTGGTQYDLQMRAINAAGDGLWSATLTGMPTQAGTNCATGGAVPDAANNPRLVSDCDTLLEIRDTLAGTATLNWSATAAIATWEGVSVSAVPQRVTRLNLVRRGLTGTIPAELSRLTGLAQLTLINNQLTGTIPSGLGGLTNLTQLQLWGNRLVGAIPSEIGSLTNLQQLHLYDNRLTGAIPAELRHLTNLEEWWLSGNQLSGTIPSWLGSLNNLQSLDLHDNQLSGTIPATLNNLSVLYLAGNQLTGCIPPDVRPAPSNDLHLLGMLFCDVLLSDLSITNGTLSPQFDAYVTVYTVAAHASRITVSPTNQNSATFEYVDPEFNILADADRSQAGQQVDVPADTVTNINVRVISPDRLGINTYTMHVTGPGAVGAPNIGQIAASATSLTVSWSAPSQTGGSAITAYDLRHIQSDATSKADADWTVVRRIWAGSGQLGYSLTGLTGGTQYDVQLRAVNTAGDGPWSATMSGTTTATRPGAPSLTATANGPTRIDLSWEAPQNTGGASITGYRIEVSENRSSWSGLVTNSRSTATGYSHTGRTAGSTWHYRVSAINVIGVGAASNVATASTASADVAGAPTIASVAGQDQSLNISWSAPSQTGGSAITTYDLRHIQSDATSKADADWTVVRRIWAGSGQLGYSLTGLTGGTQYDVQLRAVNTAGDGPWSATMSGTPIVTVSIPNSPANARYSRDGSTTVVNWDASTGATHYKVYHSDSRFPRCSKFSSGTLSGCEELSGSVSGTTFTHTDPDANTNNYWITACNSAGCSEIDSANPAQFIDNRPSAPADEQYRRDGRTTVVSWGASSGATHYKVYHDDFFGSNCRLGSSGRPSFCEELATNVAGTTYTHTSPNDNTNYYWITACNSAGCSDIDSANPARLEGSAPAPDLVVDTPTLSTSGPTAGASFTLNATVRNQGNGRSSLTTLRYYQSSDSTITTTDTEVGTESVSGLSASASGDESISLTAPSTPGTYYYGACVEAVSGESDTTNNCSSGVTVTVGAAPAPDLVVDTPTVSESAPSAGGRFTLNATVRNQGNSRSNFTTLRYYQSTDSTITTGDTGVGTDSVPGLNASASGDDSISLTAPSTPGTYYYGACVDAASDETNTTNNCSDAVTVTVGAAPAPDLVVDTPTVSSAPTAGASFTLSATVRNQGNGSSAFTTLRYYRSSDSTITTGDTEVGTDSVSRINASGSGDESISLTAPSTSGTYYYGVCVDAVSDETDKTNNCSDAVTVIVGAAPAPDLVVGTPTVSESAPAAGSRFTLSATVRNQGSGRSGLTTLRYYQSSDSTITTGDTGVGTDSVSGLNASASGDESISLTAPSSAGTYHYGACVDTVTDELDTQNNCSDAVTVTVGAAPAPDLLVDTPTVNESAPAAGTRFTLSATVRNQGNGSSSSTTLRFYRSTDSTITTTDTEVGTESVSGLSASASGDESISVTAPSTSGTYYYGACVDAVSGELDTTNNCSSAVSLTVPTITKVVKVDYDSDGNSLMEIANLQQLNAVRWDLNGDGAVDVPANTSNYTEAFPNAADNMGCAPSGCAGYELMRNLDFSSPGSHASGTVDQSWRTGTGWEPIGGLRALNSGFSTGFNTEFDGNGHTISNLYIDYTGETDDNHLGLFGRTRGESFIHDIGLVAVDVAGGWHVGGLAGGNSGVIRDSSASGKVSGSSENVGGLVGSNQGAVRTSHAAASVSGDNSGNFGGLVGSNRGTIIGSYATGRVSKANAAGGLVGINWNGTIATSYATGDVSGWFNVGGLVGLNLGNAGPNSSATIVASYATGNVSASWRYAGGLVGTNSSSSGSSAILQAGYSTGTVSAGEGVGGLVGNNSGVISASYWDTTTSGRVVGVGSDDTNSNNVLDNEETATPGAAGKRTAQLKTPSGYTGIYASWSIDLDGDGNSDNPWDFGTSSNYPTLNTVAVAKVVLPSPTVAAPSAPTGLTATADGQTAIDLSWTAPSDDGRTAITGYKIEVSTDNSTWTDLTANTGSTATSYSHTSLDADSTRHYRVSAINSAGMGPASSSDSATTETAANSAPEAVGSIPDQTIVLDTELNVDVSPYFNDPDDDSLTYTSWSPQLFNRESFSGSTLTLLLSTLVIPCEPTTVTVTARDEGGLEATQQFTVRRVNNPPVTSADTFPPQTIDVGESSPLYVGNWFSDPDDCDDRLTYTATTSDPSIVTASASGNNVTIVGVAVGRSPETVTITARDSEELEASLDILVWVLTEPGAPTGLTATADGQTRIDLSWSAPSDDGGTDINGYRIEVSTDGSSWRNFIVNTRSTSTSYSHTGLMAGTTRHYRVSAINPIGTGPVSNTDSATTDSPPAATAPGAPTSLTATADGQTEIDLSWRAPSDDGGAAITAYRIEVSTDGSNWSDLEANTGSTSTSYSHTGLTAGSTRYYRVSAINSAGTGTASNTDSATTEQAPSPTPPPNAKAVTGEITSCTGEQVGLINRITITGTLSARRAVQNVRVTGEFNGDFLGFDLIGDMESGESASFSITGYSSESVGSCRIEFTWLEFS